MLESIIEKILLSNFGQMIQGLDKINLKLGIWKGNIIFNNVCLRPEIFDQLELPLLMMFSHIGKLDIKVPWSSLGSKPVEVVLEDIFIILSQSNEKEWKNIDYASLEKRIDAIEIFAKEYLNKIYEKQKENIVNDLNNNHDQGFVAKMMEKIIDNLQITVHNIHIRFESGTMKHFAFGFTLDEVLIHTTNDKWEKEFINRSDEKNKFVNLRKLLLVKSAGVYWDTDSSTQYLLSLDKAEILEKMAINNTNKKENQTINNKDEFDFSKLSNNNEGRHNFEKNYIVLISASIQLMQNNRLNPLNKNNPEIDMKLLLRPIEIKISKGQIEDLIYLLEYFSKYKRFKTRCLIETKNKAKDLEPDELEKLKAEFKELYYIYLTKTQKKEFKTLEQKINYAFENNLDFQRFKMLLTNLPDKCLVSGIKHILKEYYKQNKVKEMKEQSKSKQIRKGIMGFFTKTPSFDDTQITVQEEIKLKELQGQLDIIFDNIDSESELQPAGVISALLANALGEISIENLLQVNISIEGGLVYLNHAKPDGSEEGIELKYTEVDINFNLTTKSICLEFDLSEFIMSLKKKYNREEDYICSPIIKRAFDTSNNKNNKMVKVKFQKNPEGKNEGLYYYLECKSIEVLYNIHCIVKLMDLFSVKTEDESLIVQAMQFGEQVQDKAKESLKNIMKNTVKNYIYVKISSPILVVPFLQNGSLKSECWVTHLGDLEIITKNPDNLDDQAYEMYDLCLKNIKIEYFPSQSLYLKLKENYYRDFTSNPQSEINQKSTEMPNIKSPNLNSSPKLDETDDDFKNKFTILDDFCIDANVKLKGIFHSEDNDNANELPILILNANIPGINIQLSQKIYNSLLRTKEFISFSNDSLSLELMETEKMKILSSSLKLGFLFLREKKYQKYIWNRYYVVFSGSYLHFFKNASDKSATFAIYVKDAYIENFIDAEKKYAFTLENRYNKAYIACDDQVSQKEWIYLIKVRIMDLSAKYEQSAFEVELQKEADLNADDNSLSSSKIMDNNENLELLNVRDDIVNLSNELEEKTKFRQEIDNIPQKKIRYDLANIIVLFSITNLKLALVENDGTPYLDLESKYFSSSFYKYPSKISISAKLHALEINDRTYTYHNPNLQVFLISCPTTNSNISNETKDFVEINLNFVDRQHPEWESIKTLLKINIQFGYLYVNYKPQIVAWMIMFLVPDREILRNIIGENNEMEAQFQRKQLGNSSIIKRMEKELSLNEDSEITDKKNNSKKDYFSYVNIEFGVEEFKVNLVHKLSHVCVFEVRFTQTSVWITVNPETIEVKGKLGNLQLFDMSGYPFTEDSNLNYELITPYEIIGLGEKAENLGEFYFIHYDPKNEFADHENRIFNQLTLNFYNLRINYIEQIAERLISYLDRQVLFLIDMDLSMSGASFKRIKLTNEIAKFIIEYPSFFELNSYIKNPILTLKAFPTSDEYIELNIKDVLISTKKVKNTTLFSNPSKPLEYIYRDHFTINADNIILNKVIKGNKSKISNVFCAKIGYERPLYCDVYKFLYNENDNFEISKAYIVTATFDPIIIMITSSDYLFIMKSVFQNILYDDMMDALYTYDFNKKIKNNPVIIDAYLEFEIVSLLILESKGNEEQFPFIMLNTHLAQLDFHHEATRRISIEITTKTVDICYFYKPPDELRIIEKKLIGPLEEINEYYYIDNNSGELIDKIIENIKLKSQNIKNNAIKESDENYKRIYLNVLVEFLPNKDKLLRLTVKNMHIYVIFSIFLKLLDVVIYDSSVYPPLPKYWRQMKAKYQEYYKNVGRQEGTLIISANLLNAIITTPSSHADHTANTQILVARGDLFLSFERYPTLSLHNILTEIADSEKDPSLYQVPSRYNESSVLKMSLNNAEIFLCEIAELIIHKNFNKVRKRNILLPFSFHFGRKWYAVLAETCDKLIECIKNDITIEKVIIRSSLYDIMLFYETIKFQLYLYYKHLNETNRLCPSIATNAYNTIKSLLETLKPDILLENESEESVDENDSKTQEIQFDLDNLKMDNEDNYQSTRMANFQSSRKKLNKITDNDYDALPFFKEELIMQSSGIQICLLNEEAETLIPIIEFTVYNIDIRAFLLGKQIKIGVSTVFSCLFFNPKPFKWEPILEKYGVHIELISSSNNPKLEMIMTNLQDYSSLNVNLSDEMVEMLMKLKSIWDKNGFKKTPKKRVSSIFKESTILITNNKTNANIIEEDFVEYISPYTIINEIGYDIEVERDIPNNNNIIRNSTLDKNIHHNNIIFYIENGNSINYLIESDLNKLFKQCTADFFVNSNKIKVKIIHPVYDINVINDIGIDRVYSISRQINGTTDDDKSLTTLNYQLFCELKIENGKKILTLRSPVQFKNDTTKILYFTVEYDGKIYDSSIQPNQIKAVPFDFIQGSIIIKTNNVPVNVKTKKYISDFLNEKDSLFEIKIGDEYLVLRVKKIHNDLKAYILCLEAPFSLQNCAPLPLLIQLGTSPNHSLGSQYIFELKPQEIKLETRLSRFNPLYLRSMTSGYDWSDPFLLHCPPLYKSEKDNFSAQDRAKIGFTMIDEDGNPLMLFIHSNANEKNTKKFYIYSKICIINETPFNLIYYIMDEKEKIIKAPGQLVYKSHYNEKILMMNQFIKLSICSREENSKTRSKEIPIGGLGDNAVELEVPSLKSCYELGVNIALHPCETNIPLYTKVITLSPRYVVINKNKTSIIWVRGESIDEIQEVLPESRIPFYWKNWSPKKPKNLCLKPVELNDESRDSSYWNWSGEIDINAIGTHNVMLRDFKKLDTKFLKFSTINQKSTIYILIEDLQPEHVAYKIRNESKNLDLLVYQTTQTRSNGIIVNQDGGSTPFGWMNPNNKKEIYIDFISSEFNINYHGNENKFSFDQINIHIDIDIPITKTEYVKLYATIEFEGKTKTLVVRDNTQMQEANINEISISTPSIAKTADEHDVDHSVVQIENQNKNDTADGLIKRVQITLQFLNFSFIAGITKKNQQSRCEVLHTFIKCIEFAMIETLKNKSSQLRIKYLNVDNTSSYATPFPVLLTPTKPESLKNESKEYFMDICIIQKPNASMVAYFESINVYLTHMTIKSESLFLEILLEIYNNLIKAKSNTLPSKRKSITEILLTSNQESLQIFLKKEKIELFYGWINSVVNSSEYNLFIQELIIHPLFIDLSFQKLACTNEKNDGFVNLFSGTLGVTFANIDNAGLQLTGIQLNNIFDSKFGIIKKLIDRYKDESVQTFFKLVGSVDILGNPLGLFSNISTGFKDLFEKPANGFVQGPLEGGKGLVEGAGSLFKNTISGTFNSINRVTGSLASGISTLTMDDEFIAEMEQVKSRKPKHLGDGLVQGVNSLVSGVGSGLSGLIEKPIQGASKGGFFGFIKGTFQGVTGLVVKPVTGLLEATSKTAEGIKNTATINDEKPNETRTRYPRPFYGKQKNYKAYNDTDAEILTQLSNYKGGIYSQISLLYAFDILPNPQELFNTFIFVISYEYLLYWSGKENKIIWEIETSNISKVNYYKDKLEIMLKIQTKQIPDKIIKLINPDFGLNARIKKNLLDLLEYYKENIQLQL